MTGIIVLAIVLVVLLLLFVKRVPFPEHWVIDRNGRLVEKGSGYRILLPVIDKVYARVKTKIDYGIVLFAQEEQHSVDLTVGGRIKLTSPKVWISVKDPKTTVSEALDFEKQISDIAEHRLAGAINLLTVDEVLVMRAPKSAEKEEAADEDSSAQKSAAKRLLVQKIDEVVGGSPQLKDFLQRIKVEYRGVTLADFDYEEGIAQKREEKVTTEMDKIIGTNRGEATRNELLAIGETAGELEKRGFPPSEAQRISSERYQDHLVAKQGTLQKIIWQGGSGIVPELSAQWEKGKNVLGAKTPLTEEELAETGEVSGEPGEIKPAESILASLSKGLNKQKPRKLTENQKTRMKEELNSLPEEQKNQWQEYVTELVGRGYLEM